MQLSFLPYLLDRSALLFVVQAAGEHMQHIQGQEYLRLTQLPTTQLQTKPAMQLSGSLEADVQQATSPRNLNIVQNLCWGTAAPISSGGLIANNEASYVHACMLDSFIGKAHSCHFCQSSACPLCSAADWR